jgi:hypothetical protein
MKLSQLTAKPQLIEITIDDEQLVQRYGEPIVFHTWDRQPMSVFMELANAAEGNSRKVIEIVRDLILDEAGRPLLTDDNMLPTDVLMAAISRITTTLGN